MKTIETYSATIYCGLRAGYTDKVHSVEFAKDICQAYCDEVGLCVTVTETTFIYTDGREDGIIVGLINYPRFPTDYSIIEDHALTLAKFLKDGLEQIRVSVVFPDITVMLED